MSDSEVEWLEVVQETQEALKVHPQDVVVLLKQGQAYFHLEEYETAAKVLQGGLRVAQDSTAQQDQALIKKFEMWIRKCNTHLAEDKKVHVDVKPEPAATTSSSASSAPAPTSESAPPQATSTPAPAPPAAAPDTGPKVRFEWFQSTTHVTITFFCKDRVDKDVDVEYEANSLTVTIRLADDKEFQHSFNPLYAEVVAGESNHTLTKYKLEIRLKKAKEVQWRAMERPATEVAAPEVVVAASAPRPTYPSSRPVKKDWDKVTADISREEADEKEEGDAALNKLFRDIYARADENTRRAMNKSFVESGGTVLSTNWEEVGSKHVEGTPPKGMEFKKPGE